MPKPKDDLAVELARGRTCKNNCVDDLHAYLDKLNVQINTLERYAHCITKRQEDIKKKYNLKNAKGLQGELRFVQGLLVDLYKIQGRLLATKKFVKDARDAQ